MRLQGKTALITGGNSGIGLASAKAFIAEGARVVITGRDPATLDAARTELGPQTLVVPSDAADLAAIDHLMATVKQHFGGLDILFVNAGAGGGGPLESITESDFDRVFDTNVKGLFFTVQKAVPLLRKGASVILNASIAPRVGRVGASVYAGSKASVRAFARNFSAELAPRGIRVNAISPGPIDTPIWSRSRPDPKAVSTVREKVIAGIPLGRMGTADEAARVVLFLASDDSSFMLGTEVTVDGGVSELPHG